MQTPIELTERNNLATASRALRLRLFLPGLGTPAGGAALLAACGGTSSSVTPAPSAAMAQVATGRIIAAASAFLAAPSETEKGGGAVSMDSPGLLRANA